MGKDVYTIILPDLTKNSCATGDVIAVLSSMEMVIKFIKNDFMTCGGIKEISFTKLTPAYAWAKEVWEVDVNNEKPAYIILKQELDKFHYDDC